MKTLRQRPNWPKNSSKSSMVAVTGKPFCRADPVRTPAAAESPGEWTYRIHRQLIQLLLPLRGALGEGLVRAATYFLSVVADLEQGGLAHGICDFALFFSQALERTRQRVGGRPVGLDELESYLEPIEGQQCLDGDPFAKCVKEI